MMPSAVSMEPVWRVDRTAGGKLRRWHCPHCPWASVSFIEVENHIEDTHCRCGLDANHWPEEG